MHTIWGACAFGIGTQGVLGVGNGVGIPYGVLVMGQGGAEQLPWACAWHLPARPFDLEYLVDTICVQLIGGHAWPFWGVNLAIL